jgi:hypothetical protein
LALAHVDKPSYTPAGTLLSTKDIILSVLWRTNLDYIQSRHAEYRHQVLVQYLSLDAQGPISWRAYCGTPQETYTKELDYVLLNKSVSSMPIQSLRIQQED